VNPAWEEHAPIYYLLRLLTFSFIIFAIIIKNKPQWWK
jgi:hypothetical protein